MIDADASSIKKHWKISVGTALEGECEILSRNSTVSALTDMDEQ